MVGCFVFSCFASHGYEWHLHAYYYFPLLLEFRFAGFFLTSIYLFCVIDRRWFSWDNCQIISILTTCMYTVGLENAWPMSVLVQAMTTDSDSEITECINLVRNSSRLGLVHESVNVNDINQYTRSWFAWANSVFAKTILKIAAEKPHLIFGVDADPYVVWLCVCPYFVCYSHPSMGSNTVMDIFMQWKKIIIYGIHNKKKHAFM